MVIAQERQLVSFGFEIVNFTIKSKALGDFF